MKLREVAPRQIAVGVVLVGVGWLLNSASQPFQRNARTSACQSNLKRISMAALQYARDYDECFPLAPSWADGLSPYWFGSRSPTRENNFQQIFRCPTSRAYYALNKFSAGDAVKSQDWRDTNEIPFAFDVSWSTRNFSDDGSLWPLDPPIHGTGKYGGNNVVFADGHAKLMTVKPEFRALTPLPHPTSQPTPRAQKPEKR